jgi:transcriptional regulator with XRE-family HTH domain
MVGPLVKQRREARGLTQTELAERTGLRQTYISQVESGEIVMPRDHNLDKMGAVLGISRGEFYRAAGMLDGIEQQPANGQVPTSPARDADWVPIAQKVADVEARRGEHYQRRLQAARERMNRADYEAFCAALWGMWEGNSLMVFQLLDRDGGTE